MFSDRLDLEIRCVAQSDGMDRRSTLLSQQTIRRSRLRRRPGIYLRPRSRNAKSIRDPNVRFRPLELGWATLSSAWRDNTRCVMRKGPLKRKRLVGADWRGSVIRSASEASRRAGRLIRTGFDLIRRQNQMAFSIDNPDERSSAAQLKLSLPERVVYRRAGSLHHRNARAGCRMHKIDLRHFGSPSLSRRQGPPRPSERRIAVNSRRESESTYAGASCSGPTGLGRRNSRASSGR